MSNPAIINAMANIPKKRVSEILNVDVRIQVGILHARSGITRRAAMRHWPKKCQLPAAETNALHMRAVILSESCESAVKERTARYMLPPPKPTLLYTMAITRNKVAIIQVMLRM